MALFMDAHTIGGPVTLDDVAKAHAADLQTQDAHGVHYLRYWVDQEHGKIFCLVDAPDAGAAATVHREAAGVPVAQHGVPHGRGAQLVQNVQALLRVPDLRREGQRVGRP